MPPVAEKLPLPPVLAEPGLALQKTCCGVGLLTFIEPTGLFCAQKFPVLPLPKVQPTLKLFTGADGAVQSKLAAVPLKFVKTQYAPVGLIELIPAWP